MIFSLEVIKARKGDCLILHCGSEENRQIMLIDGGPDQVYQPFLKPRLDQIKKSRNLESGKPLPIDLMMVSHIDDDHIQGLIELTNDLTEAKDEQRPVPYKIRNLWHNTMDEITADKTKDLISAVTSSFGAASLTGEPDTEGLNPESAMVLASVAQGNRLRDNAKKLNISLNSEFQGKLIKAAKETGSLNMGQGLLFYVVGPMEAELSKLQKEFEKFLKKQKEKKKAEAMLAAFSDTSIPNLSSLVIMAEMDDKSILLTGDARGDKILKGLELTGKLKKNKSMHVDILKIPHHGSSRNLDPVFFRRITADHYVFSGNGEHGNPEKETLQMLLDERSDQDFTVHITYSTGEIDGERKKDWEKEQDKEKKRKKKNPATMVREDWSDEKHSLKSFLEANKNFAEKVRVVEDGNPHIINLLDKFEP